MNSSANVASSLLIAQDKFLELLKLPGDSLGIFLEIFDLYCK